MSIRSDLIAKGYFPAELIPAFTTKSLDNAHVIQEALKGKYKNRSEFFSTSKCSRYSIPRLRKHRRSLGLPNPLHYIQLCNVIADHWNQIDKHCKQSNLSYSKPTYKSTNIRAVTSEFSFSQMTAEKTKLACSGLVRLVTDINRYYGSIYTHSIPWSLHTKTVAKRKRRDFRYTGNVLDSLAQRMMDGQTVGIPIGPDTSLILSEIIGTSLDIYLQEKMGEMVGCRYIDDYSLFFENRLEAEEALSIIQSALLEYELEINPRKTFIEELPFSCEPSWVIELRQFPLGNRSHHLLGFFSRAFENATLFDEESVLRYALTKLLGNLKVDFDNWELFESLLMQSAITDSSVIPLVARVIYSYDQIHYPVNRGKIQKALNTMINYHSNFSHSYELSWILWFACNMNISLEEEHVIKKISSIRDPIVALVSLDLESKGLVKSKFDKTLWEEMANEGFTSEYWLLAYESSIRGWLKSNLPRKNEYCYLLHKNNISFYDSQLTMEPIDWPEQTPFDLDYFPDGVLPEGAETIRKGYW